MKKTPILVLASCLLLLTLCSDFSKKNVSLPSIDDLPPIETVEVAPKKSEFTGKTIETFTSFADLAVIYKDFVSLSADAEVIVMGTVKEIESYSGVPVTIHSDIVLEVKAVLKGDIEDETVCYTMYGGRMLAREWYQANAENIKDKVTPEVYEETLNSMLPTDMMESFFMGVKNVELGDELLLFLTYDEDKACYRATGSSYNGKYYFDESSDSVFKIIDGEKTMVSTLSDVKALAEITPDNSAKIREEWESRVPIEKEAILEERDPAFDKYKE